MGNENLNWLFSTEDCNIALSKSLYQVPLDACYKCGGNTILRSRDHRILIGIDHAALGFGTIAAHGHADALSFQMYVNKENPNNESFIKQHISQELKIETFDITLDCLGQRIHEKFSESTHEEKVYSHRFYLAKISKFPDMMLQDSFECDGKQYYWMTVPELEQDENVQKKNNDILGYVKELV